ncbi:hypothetical protein BU16DRAFT_460607 [Lophium mytilinum]|uniref:Kynurenine formamidase n=1 Tax=Lophium mytilinum TaxID=390894 RepID=A0A6A6QWF3_9PEZI|nr:hypothetical protein BU16DRAFT_460607 [Lophium mytilinum]
MTSSTPTSPTTPTSRGGGFGESALTTPVSPITNTPLKQFHSYPYTNPPIHILQTVTIWLPRPLEDSDPNSTKWLIYLHGGAWRDPECSSKQFIPTVNYLDQLSDPATMSAIAGFASINYRLSPYPPPAAHPSDPSDPYRNVQHPTHLNDVCVALAYLSARFRIEDYGWVGIGHSAGATLWTQLLSDVDVGTVPRPSAAVRGSLSGLVLLAGIYDLPLFLELHRAPLVDAKTQRIYEQIVTGAFGEDPVGWAVASPANARYVGEEWPALGLVVLARSKGDQLVEEEQDAEIEAVLRQQGWVGEGEEDGGRGRRRKLWVRQLEGGHDEVWQSNKGQIAGLVQEVFSRLGFLQAPLIKME